MPSAAYQRSEGIERPCTGCGLTITSFAPPQFQYRPQYCPTCKVERERAVNREASRRRNQSSERRVYLANYARERNRTDPAFHEKNLQRLRDYRARQPHEVVQKLAEVWPYGATGWPFEEVNAAVPHTLPETVRADVCQELCLMVIAGEVDVADLPVRPVIRRVWGDFTLSIDQRRSDGHAIADYLEASDLLL